MFHLPRHCYSVYFLNNYFFDTSSRGFLQVNCYNNKDHTIAFLSSHYTKKDSNLKIKHISPRWVCDSVEAHHTEKQEIAGSSIGSVTSRRKPLFVSKAISSAMMSPFGILPMSNCLETSRSDYRDCVRNRKNNNFFRYLLVFKYMLVNILWVMMYQKELSLILR